MGSASSCHVESDADCSEAFAREQAQFQERHLLHVSFFIFG